MCHVVHERRYIVCTTTDTSKDGVPSGPRCPFTKWNTGKFWRYRYRSRTQNRESYNARRALERVENAGSDLTYRCVNCRNYSDCKKSEQIQCISIEEEIEQDIIDSSVQAHISIQEEIEQDIIDSSVQAHISIQEEIEQDIIDSSVQAHISIQEEIEQDIIDNSVQVHISIQEEIEQDIIDKQCTGTHQYTGRDRTDIIDNSVQVHISIQEEIEQDIIDSSVHIRISIQEEIEQDIIDSSVHIRISIQEEIEQDIIDNSVQGHIGEGVTTARLISKQKQGYGNLQRSSQKVRQKSS